MDRSGGTKLRMIVMGCCLLAAAAFFWLQSMDIMAADGNTAKKTTKKEKYGTFVGKAPDTYTISGNTIYFYPKRVSYSGTKVVCSVYVVNKSGHKIKALSDLKLSLRDKNNKKIAEYTFKAKRKLVIRDDKYKIVKFTFPKSSVVKKKFYFGKAQRLTIKASYTCHS